MAGGSGISLPAAEKAIALNLLIGAGLQIIGVIDQRAFRRPYSGFSDNSPLGRFAHRSESDDVPGPEGCLPGGTEKSGGRNLGWFCAGAILQSVQTLTADLLGVEAEDKGEGAAPGGAYRPTLGGSNFLYPWNHPITTMPWVHANDRRWVKGINRSGRADWVAFNRKVL